MSRERELLKRVRDTLLELKETHYDLYWDIQTALDLREDLREEGLRDQITWLQGTNDRLEADLMLAKTALAETMKLFNNQPNDSGLRDHFAGLAMQSLLTKTSATVGSDSVAMAAYHVAHQMLKERSRGEKIDA